MTEIPEHLLKRSKERRQAMGLPTDEGSSTAGASEAVAAASAPSAATPARIEASAPATAPAGGGKPPKGPAVPAKAAAAPLPPYIQAAKRRRRIPIWAMPVLGLLPIWGFLYWEAMNPHVTKAVGPIAAGEELFQKGAGCAACHLASGAGWSQGGVGRQLSDGQVLQTFPNFADQVAFIRHGSYAKGTPYGNPDREGGQHIAQEKGVMPAFKSGTLTDAQLTDIVCYIRITLSGEDPTVNADYCSETATLMVSADDAGTITNAEAARA